MQEYRRKYPTLVVARQRGKSPAHTIDSLAAQFGINIMDSENTVPNSRPGTVTATDEEYSTYINGDLWEEDSDPLKFWEVGRSPALQVLCAYDI